MAWTPEERVSLRNSMYKKVKITEVNMKKFHVESVDQQGASYRVEISSQPGFVRIPNVGEDWIINRIDNLWKLAYRYETQTEKVAIETLQPGDVRIEGEKVYINGNININGLPYRFTKTVYNEIPNGLIDGVNSFFACSTYYIPKTLRVYHNGLLTVEFEEINNIAFDLVLVPQVLDQVVVEYERDLLAIRTDASTQQGVGH